MLEQKKISWSVYVLLCSDGTFYTGITNNLSRRIEQHNAGIGAKYTRGRTPVKLLYSEETISRSAATIREREIKSLSKAQKNTLCDI